MNSNTIVGFNGGTGRNQIGLQTLASVTETEFKVNQDAGANNAIAVLTVPQGTEILGSSNPLNPCANAAILGADRGSQFGRGLGEQAPYFCNTVYDMAKFGLGFKIRLSAFYTAVANAGNTLQIKIYSGSTKGGTVIAQNTAVATASAASGSFIFEVRLQWNSTTQVLVGNQNFSFDYNGTQVANGFSAGAVLTNAASVTSVAGLTFCATATWGNAVGGTVQVNEFVMEAM
jgi:hypothetical protein